MKRNLTAEWPLLAISHPYLLKWISLLVPPTKRLYSASRCRFCTYSSPGNNGECSTIGFWDFSTRWVRFTSTNLTKQQLEMCALFTACCIYCSDAYSWESWQMFVHVSHLCRRLVTSKLWETLSASNRSKTHHALVNYQAAYVSPLVMILQVYTSYCFDWIKCCLGIFFVHTQYERLSLAGCLSSNADEGNFNCYNSSTFVPLPALRPRP